MGTLAFLILSILCAVLPHKILASSSGGASSSDSPRAYSPTSSSTPPICPTCNTRRDERLMRPLVFKGPASPSFTQSLYEVHTENPTHVLLTENGNTLGPGLAIHSYFVVSRREFYRKGCEVSTYEGEKLKPHKVFNTIPHENIILIDMYVPLLLGQGHSEPDALLKHGYTREQIEWADDHVRSYIKRVFSSE